MKKLFIVVFLFMTNIAFSQNDVQMAFDYFNSNQFDKAEVLFDKLFKQNKAFFYYEYYIRCLVAENKYKDAEKELIRDTKKEPDNLNYQVLLGFTYRAWGKDNDANQVFKQVLQQLPKNEAIINDIGTRMVNIKEYDWAEQILKKGEEYFPGKFLQNLGVLYNLKRDYTNMISSYMDLLAADANSLNQIRQVFLYNMQNNDPNNEFSNSLEKNLLQRLQKQKDIQSEEMLIWFYTQKAQYSKALIYAMAMDKRQNLPARTYNIGVAAFQNEEYKISSDAFTFAKSFGEASPYFVNSETYLLKTMYYQIVNNQISDTLEIKKIENEYLTFINQNNSGNVIEATIDLAHLQGFYLHEEKKAIDLISKKLQSNISTKDKTLLLMEQADLYLHAEQIWDAILTYAAIETQYPNLEISDEAKFKKAKAYFYLQQFKWAKDQWDILKGSPSKLIANDAIYWSYFVENNTDADSTFAALKAFSKADFYFYCGKIDKSMKMIDTLMSDYSTDNIIPYTLYLESDIYQYFNDFEKAAQCLETIVNTYSYSIIADKSAYTLAVLYETKLNQKQKAMDMYKKILFDFPSSFYTDEARTKYKELGGI